MVRFFSILTSSLQKMGLSGTASYMALIYAANADASPWARSCMMRRMIFSVGVTSFYGVSCRSVMQLSGENRNAHLAGLHFKECVEVIITLRIKVGPRGYFQQHLQQSNVSATTSDSLS